MEPVATVAADAEPGEGALAVESIDFHRTALAVLAGGLGPVEEVDVEDRVVGAGHSYAGTVGGTRRGRSGPAGMAEPRPA